MRIELIPSNQARFTGKSGLEPESIALERGEVINARAINHNGDALIFRSQDGRTFSASLSDPSLILPGDQVEFMVTGSAAGRIVLHLLSVDPASQRCAPMEAEGLPANDIKMDSVAAEILKSFQSMDRTTSPDVIQEAVTLVKEQGLDVQEAVFFAANHKDATKAQIFALRSFSEGETLGSMLHQIALTLEHADEGNQTTRQQITGGELRATQGQNIEGKGSVHAPIGYTGAKENHVLPQTEHAPAETQMAPQDRSPVQATTNGQLQNSAEKTVQTAKLAPQPLGTPIETDGSVPMSTDRIQNAQEFAPEMVRTQSGMIKGEQNAAGMSIPALESDLLPSGMMSASLLKFEDAAQQKAEAQQHADTQEQVESPKPKALTGLAEKILSAFTDPENTVNGASVKKNAASVKEQLVTLARLTSGADGKEAEALAPKLMRTAAQGTLFQNLDRVAVMQVPIHLKKYDTAELYVYKRAKHTNGIDADNTSMLIGLTTEHLGRIETLVRVERKNLSLSFYVQDQALCAEVEDRMDELIVALKDLEFRVSGAKVDLLKERTTPQSAEKTLSAAIKKTGAGFDCRI